MASTPATRNGNGGTPAKANPSQTVHDLLMRSKSQIALALPKHMDPDRLCRIALTTIRQTPKLLECDQISLVKCVVQCAALGLEPDPLLGRAYLVPFGKECQLIIGYRGMIDLARRSGQILSIEAHVVHEQDEWRYSYGLDPELYHRPADVDDPGRVVAAWALARFKDGGHEFTVLSVKQLEKIRKTSKQAGGTFWTQHTEEMYRKTVLRRLCKTLPLSPAILEEIGKEESREFGGEVYQTAETDLSALPTPEADPTSTTESDKVLARMGTGSLLPDTDTHPGAYDEPGDGG